jgi:hypothetical protein
MACCVSVPTFILCRSSLTAQWSNIPNATGVYMPRDVAESCCVFDRLQVPWVGELTEKGILSMEALTLLGTIFGLGFVSGLNLYATVIAVGLIVNLNLATLPESMQDLSILGHPTVMIVAGVLFAIEFVADKIPWVDSSWDSVHTLVRPVGAAVMGGYALTGADPAVETALALACGGVALTSHTTKASTRVMANASPEPFSNAFLSVFEDVIVVLGIGLTFLLPLVMLATVVVFLMVFIWLTPKFYRIIKGSFGKVRGVFGRSKEEAV